MLAVRPSSPQTVDFEAAKEPAQATPEPPSAIPAVQYEMHLLDLI